MKSEFSVSKYKSIILSMHMLGEIRVSIRGTKQLWPSWIFSSQNLFVYSQCFSGFQKKWLRIKWLRIYQWTYSETFSYQYFFRFNSCVPKWLGLNLSNCSSSDLNKWRPSWIWRRWNWFKMISKVENNTRNEFPLPQNHIKHIW